MQNSAETPKEPRPQREYDDPHFHDDDETEPADDGEPRGPRRPAWRKTIRRPPPRRRYEED